MIRKDEALVGTPPIRFCFKFPLSQGGSELQQAGGLPEIPKWLSAWDQQLAEPPVAVPGTELAHNDLFV